MIQRIQSVYLLLASLALGGLHFLPLGKGDAMSTGILSDSLFNIYDSNLLLGAAILGAVVLFITIFLFKNRKIQKGAATAGLFFIGVFMGILAMAYLDNREILNSDNHFAFGLGMGLPIVALIFTGLGRMGIVKDDQIVKSMDRLR